ncbi:MAG: MarR family winged helix-turn-helix transcriptional regulator [Alphaproteobacteria bacterium]
MADFAESGFSLVASASHLLQRTLQLAEDRFAVLARASGLTLRQFAVLAAAHAEPGLSQSDLVRATGIDRSTMADMLARMERRSLLTRIQSAEDARANSVRLTPAGVAALTGSVTHGKAADAAILDHISEAKQKALLSTLTRILRKADEELERQIKADKRAARRQARVEAKARDKAEGRKHKRKRKHKNKIDKVEKPEKADGKRDKKSKPAPSDETVSKNAS